MYCLCLHVAFHLHGGSGNNSASFRSRTAPAEKSCAECNGNGAIKVNQKHRLRGCWLAISSHRGRLLLIAHSTHTLHIWPLLTAFSSSAPPVRFRSLTLCDHRCLTRPVPPSAPCSFHFGRSLPLAFQARLVRSSRRICMPRVSPSRRSHATLLRPRRSSPASPLSRATPTRYPVSVTTAHSGLVDRHCEGGAR